MAPSAQVLHIAGWSTCAFYRRAASVLSSLSVLFPTKIKIIEHSYPSRTEYRAWLIDGGFRDQVHDDRAKSHTSSPFCWVADKPTSEPDVGDIKSFIGGHDDCLTWCRAFCSPSESSAAGESTLVEDGHKSDHGYEYDLVVIGGGSGGLAASKEASALGAKVAVLDFVKPSPAGTQWGLGGTCVNVGCIPKKLMHNAALINEAVILDSAAFGISTGAGEGKPATQHTWDTMRENIQNHIRGLNFKYRVNLREKNVKYLNKLGKFKDAHTLEVTDKKGRTSEITASRFIVAVGGRPTGLNCEGGELAISSDDVFALEKSPGKTLCVGASYISLECAGFLAGIGHDVTVAVRSILLRGFDRECADKIGAYMDDHGVNFKREVVPKKLEKVDGDRIKVTFSDDTDDVYDTVLVAIGRTADTSKLGLENIDVKTNGRNLKIPAKDEQTSCPNVYCIGDVMEGVPELTPAAIQGGINLSRRLFGESKVPMDYKNVCTTVFTPIEYGTVGFSEDDAMEEFGCDNIDVYHKSFVPLEWSLSDGRSRHQGFTKVIVDKSDGDRVLGIHFLGPNAGEVMQGYGTAIKKGLTFKDLEDTVGIHPTSAEEIVTLTVTKRSGEDAAAGGC
uniref:Thioredoxin-disulfide reductase n=1 Tax=Odontella aurita TaxID=265563 RepID=A0A7S4MQN0_9STRA|mmetsp:Transcript_29076/g.86059  ORF Transcript_29076/g.86059 Transcript_29076/m.86059 type:complete len:618 (+) Transcript_29076:125-1978(+)|eukprot:CAMPEP_0113537360 /NCGR_PEP_ID=MMETSP0015_2-20120614/6784_1 /TAXON_ID=2838 /ORGANISM="Odontella" /LENGTH=617 /DNA_ID=CAMNT_0000436849 /DNA_START=10 /DNA_END=1863 /DNA_ORIENTATION=+ /assembly_acc=CAM_ASM_000160